MKVVTAFSYKLIIIHVVCQTCSLAIVTVIVK